MRILKTGFGVAGLAVALLGVTGVASASTIYDLNLTDVAAFGAPNYGTVTLTQNGANVDVQVDLRADLDFVTTGGPHSVFSFNLAGATTADITNIVFAGPPGYTVTVVQSGQNTPFGTFYLAIDCTSCQNGAPGKLLDPLTFTALNATVADFAHLSTVPPGTYPAYFAADVICVSGSCNGATGAVGATRPGRPGDVPEPASLALLGLGLLGLGVTRRARA